MASIGLVYDGKPAPNSGFTDNFSIPSLLFLLGLLLGDGSITLRIRHVASRKGSI